jgi:hypothetical protein
MLIIFWSEKMYYRYCDDYQEIYRKAVTAYTLDVPIYVNGYNIDQNPYPVLYYRAYTDKPYYSYVPIVMFDKVGAKVVYDSQANIINVTTDYYLNKVTLMEQENQLKELQAKNNELEQLMKLNREYVQYQGAINGYYKFSNSYWNLSNNLEDTFKVGYFYKVINQDVAKGSRYITILKDSKEVVLQVSNRDMPKGIIYIGKREKGLQLFRWENSNNNVEFMVLKPSDKIISLEPGRGYVVVKDYTIPGYDGDSYSIVGTDIVIA